MWIRVNGRDELVINPLHIKLFLEAGGVEIDDPTAQKQEEAPQVPEQDTELPEGGESSDGTEQEEEQPPVEGSEQTGTDGSDGSTEPLDDGKKSKRGSK
jgi:hypothetical protein